MLEFPLLGLLWVEVPVDAMYDMCATSTLERCTFTYNKFD